MASVIRWRWVKTEFDKLRLQSTDVSLDIFSRAPVLPCERSTGVCTGKACNVRAALVASILFEENGTSSLQLSQFTHASWCNASKYETGETQRSQLDES